MKIFLFIYMLIAYTICAPKKRVKNEARTKIFECILASDGASQNLKSYVNSIKKSPKFIHFNFHNLKLGDGDIEILRGCKKSVFQEIMNKNRDKD